jgi:hypothetical protein
MSVIKAAMTRGLAERTTDHARTLLRKAWPQAFRDGVRSGLGLIEQSEQREPGNYPKGFHGWPLEKRNAWFAGYNVGRVKRLKLEEEGGEP